MASSSSRIVPIPLQDILARYSASTLQRWKSEIVSFDEIVSSFMKIRSKVEEHASILEEILASFKPEDQIVFDAYLRIGVVLGDDIQADRFLKTVLIATREIRQTVEMKPERWSRQYLENLLAQVKKDDEILSSFLKIRSQIEKDINIVEEIMESFETEDEIVWDAYLRIRIVLGDDSKGERFLENVFTAMRQGRQTVTNQEIKVHRWTTHHFRTLLDQLRKDLEAGSMMATAIHDDNDSCDVDNQSLSADRRII